MLCCERGSKPIESWQRTMIISDETLLDDEKLYQIREVLDAEASGWGRSESEKSLKARYWKVPQSTYRSLKVCWDFRPIAIRLSEATGDYLRACRLYECDLQQLLFHLSQNHNWRFDRLFEEAKENRLLRVIGLWEIGSPLTPPVLTLRDDGRLGKIDGFHRLAVAIAAEVPCIPFWAAPPIDLSGVRELPKFI